MTCSRERMTGLYRRMPGGRITRSIFDDGGNNGGQGEECCFTEAELKIAKEGTTSPPAMMLLRYFLVYGDT
jgi:hypothetical protein